MRNASLVRLAVFGLLVAAVLVIVIVNPWKKRASDDPGATGGMTSPSPRSSSEVWYANHGPLVCVLAPLYRERRRADHERRWLARALDHDPERVGYLYLHLFHRGVGGSAAFDPASARVELRIDNTWAATDRALGAEVAGRIRAGQVIGTGAMFLRNVAPEKPLDLPVNGLARTLLAFDRPDPWARLDGARLRVGPGNDIPFRSASVSDAVWESLLAGGPIPEALAPDPQLEASLSGDGAPGKAKSK